MIVVVGVGRFVGVKADDDAGEIGYGGEIGQGAGSRKARGFQISSNSIGMADIVRLTRRDVVDDQVYRST